MFYVLAKAVVENTECRQICTASSTPGSGYMVCGLRWMSSPFEPPPASCCKWPPVDACLSAASSRPARWSLCGGCGGQVACLAWPHSPACGITLPAPHIPPARQHFQSSLAALTGFQSLSVGSTGFFAQHGCPVLH